MLTGTDVLPIIARTVVATYLVVADSFAQSVTEGITPFSALQSENDAVLSCLCCARAGNPLDCCQSRAAIAMKEPSDQTRLSLCPVDAVGQFARGQYADVAELLKLVSVDQRISVGGSRVERVLIDLLEARAVELAA